MKIENGEIVNVVDASEPPELKTISNLQRQAVKLVADMKKQPALTGKAKKDFVDATTAAKGVVRMLGQAMKALT